MSPVIYQRCGKFYKRLLLSVLLVCLGLETSICVANTKDQNFIPPHAVWKYRTKSHPPPVDWPQLKFDDSHWLDGLAGFGYGDDDDRTVLDSMRGQFDSVQIRYRFKVVRPSSIHELFLYLRYDDGFVAYLNGQEVASAGVKWRGKRRVVADHEAKGFEEFKINHPEVLLHQGWNILAIEGFNRSLKSGDFSLDPVLTTQRTENPGIPKIITQKEYLADLDELEQRIKDQASYLLLKDYNFQKAFSRLRRLRRATAITQHFALDLERILAQLGDAHARVITRFDDPNARFLPFVLADTRDGLVALKADLSGFIDDNSPLIVALDGRAISSWIKAASEYVAQASPQLIRYRSVRELRAIDRLRNDLDLPASESIRLTLKSLDGERQVKRRMALSHEKLSSGKVPIGPTRLLDSNIGYLRISSMKNSQIKHVHSAMNDFQETNGLIIDVRDNKGGRYGILQALYGYFIPNNAPPYVANIAAYRLSPRFADDHLYYRPTYRMDWRGWTIAKRQAIKKTLEVFHPEWPLPKNKFSSWHFMVLGRSKSPRQYFYPKPVVVLCNAGSFSATDVFLSAFADLPQVTLVGQPSSGGSGSKQEFDLPYSGIRIALSSMASFRPNGKLFDGKGIDVDIKILPDPSDFFGKTDFVLSGTIDWITQSRKKK